MRPLQTGRALKGWWDVWGDGKARTKPLGDQAEQAGAESRGKVQDDWDDHRVRELTTHPAWSLWP